MKKIFLCLLIITTALIFISCDDEMTTGTVVYMDLEGGFYGIVDDEGNKYNPTNLTEEFREDSLRVKFTFRRTKQQMSIQMWGTMVEITAMKKLE
ncbi:MAG: hypothetical protein R6W90_13010 [Ignavibacteriaceae bacterium]